MSPTVWDGKIFLQQQQQQQDGAGEVRPQPTTINIQERCNGVLQKIELVSSLVSESNFRLTWQ